MLSVSAGLVAVPFSGKALAEVESVTVPTVLPGYPRRSSYIEQKLLTTVPELLEPQRHRKFQVF